MMIKLKRFALCFSLFFCHAQVGLANGLEVSLAADMLFGQGLNQESLADEKLSIRSAELSVGAEIDHNFSGFVAFAAHEEAGESVLEVHEAYFETTGLLQEMKFKVGQFFLGVGRLNRFHQHDWSFTRAPKVHRDFFDDEAVFDTGVEGSVFLSSQYFIQLTFGVTSGYKYGHLHSEGNKPKAPTHYVRFSQFKEDSMSAASGSEWGLTYLGRTNAQSEEMKLIGLDFVHKKREGRVLKWLYQSEFWYRGLKDKVNSTEQEQVGFYFFAERGWSQLWSSGLRLDGLKDFSRENLSGDELNHIHYGLTLQQTYRSSEFFSTRLSASHEFERVEGATLEKDTRLMAQFVFILGSHPAHIF